MKISYPTITKGIKNSTLHMSQILLLEFGGLMRISLTIALLFNCVTCGHSHLVLVVVKFI